MTWCQRPGSSLTGHLLCPEQQRLREEFQRAGDDNGDGGGHLANLVVTLHYLLDPSLKIIVNYFCIHNVSFDATLT